MEKLTAWAAENCRFAQKKPRNDACPICGKVVRGGDKSIEPFFNHTCKPSVLHGIEGADKGKHDIGSQDIGNLSVAEDMAKSMMGYNKAWVLKNCKFAQSEAVPYDFAAGKRKARKMSDEALLWTIDDIKKTLEIQEPAAREGTMQTPKLGYYADELHTMIEELNRRRNPRPKRSLLAPPAAPDIEARTRGVSKTAMGSWPSDPEESVQMSIDAEFNPDWADEAAYHAAGDPSSFEVTISYSHALFPHSSQTMESPEQVGGHDVYVTGVIMDDGRDILPSILAKNPKYFERFEARKAAEMDAGGQ